MNRKQLNIILQFERWILGIHVAPFYPHFIQYFILRLVLEKNMITLCQRNLLMRQNNGECDSCYYGVFCENDV